MSETLAAPLFTRGRALVIGVSSYADPAWQVPIAVRDAELIAATLADQAVGGYPRGQVELLVDAQASRAGIAAALRNLALRTSADETVCIAFTGHGALGDDELYYLGSSDATFVGERIRGGSGFSIRALAEALRAIKAQKLLVLINACFAGHLGALATRDGLRADPPLAAPSGSVLPPAEGDLVLAAGSGRALITASRSDQRSYFRRDDPHSHFGQALVSALRGSGISQASGYIGLFELYDALYRQVRRVTEQLGYAQEPVLHLVEGVGPFPVARYPAAPAQLADQGALAQTPPAGTAVRIVARDVIQAIGAGATAIRAEAGSRVSVDNSKLIDFGSANSFGDVRVGDVAKNDIIKTSIGGQPAEGDEGDDPLARLPRLAEQIRTAHNVDADAAGLAALKVGQAVTALDKGDRARARQRLSEALVELQTLDNGYIRSLARKVAAALSAL